MELAARYRVAEGGIEIGGDFYDVFEVGQGRWALVIGDVCGRGPEAAALTGLMRHSVRAAAVRDDRPSRGPGQTDDDPRPDRRHQVLTTAFVGWSPGQGEAAQLTISCGGHPCLIVGRPTAVQRVEASGTLLGVLPSPPLHDVTVELQPGSSLVLFTDGVTEARRGTEQFGERRLMSTARRPPGSRRRRPRCPHRGGRQLVPGRGQRRRGGDGATGRALGPSGYSVSHLNPANAVSDRSANVGWQIKRSGRYTSGWL